ncbi:MAG: hypothetical protein Q9205_002398 [Flavoplaca limonia]
MALEILPYSTEHYNTLPELGVAKDQFDAADVNGILYTEIRGAFVKHHVERTVGLTLLHNHFLLEPSQKLVTFKKTVALPCDPDEVIDLPHVHATAWRFTDHGIAPYEFAATTVGTTLDSPSMQAFLQEFAAVLKKWNLTNVLGIYSIKESSVDGPQTMEITEGRCNITLDMDLHPHEGTTIDAMWQFYTGTGKGPGRCKNACKGVPHVKRHLSKT